jgi:hypothetical protein
VVSLLTLLSICWAIITVPLAGLLIYRSLVAMKEEDQLFLDPAEGHLEREQQVILGRLGRLTPFLKGLAAMSTALLALIAGVWIYQGVMGIANSTFKP